MHGYIDRVVWMGMMGKAHPHPGFEVEPLVDLRTAIQKWLIAEL